MPGPREPGITRRGSGDRRRLSPLALVDHFFRHEYGRLVATLARRVGVRHLVLVEDAVQAALLSALTAWTEQKPPEEPAAWIHTVAYRRMLEELRREARRLKLLERANLAIDERADAAPFFANEIEDDLLRMLFVACDDAIPRQSQLVLALKTLCGFSIAEIALRLFASEAHVQKRLGRARQRLRDAWPDGEMPPLEKLGARLPGVRGVLYLLFNEGYLSAHAEHAIRRELTDEAMRLTTLLAEHPAFGDPETFALLALMHLHAARLDARTDGGGGLLLLEEQDRSRWDRAKIEIGAAWLERSAQGSVFSRFHAEAGIAAAHCFAPSFAETRWDEIADLYATLERVAPSPLHTMNRAVAVAEWQGAEAGLAVLADLAPPPWLAGSYLWDAVFGDLHRRAGHVELAHRHRERALASTPTDAIRALLERRLGSPH